MVDPRFTSALETALLRQLSATWHELNGNHFRSRMKAPVLGLHDGDSRLGYWESTQRRLSLSRVATLQQPWAVVREVLKHEMAHQFVDEILGIRDEAAHGPSFDAICRQLGFDAAPSGMPRLRDGDESAAQGPQAETHAVLRRIRKLLALAESPNRHEAELAMQQAQRLMLKHNIDSVASAAVTGYSFRQIGHPKRRIDTHEHALACLLANHFFVEAIWVPSYLAIEAKSGRVLEICGTASNLDVAEYVHEFLSATGERLWREHRKAQGIRGDRERRRFLLGMVNGFSEKLAQGASESRREGLVWVGDPALDQYLKQRYPRRSNGGRLQFQRTEAYEHGRAAGRELVLHRPVQSGPASGERRLLSGR